MRARLAVVLLLIPGLATSASAQDGETFSVFDPENESTRDDSAGEAPDGEDDAEVFSIADPANEAVVAEPESSSWAPTFQSTLFRGAWRLQLGLDTGHEDRCGRWSCEDVFELKNRLDLRLQTDVTDALRAVVEARFDHFVVGEKPEDRVFFFHNAQRVKGHHEVEVREAYLRWKSGPLRVTVGNQVVAWGVLDMGSSQDVINPVDYRAGLAPGGEPPRIPVLAARAVARLGKLSIDGVVAPFFQPHRMNLFGSDFAMLQGGGSGGAPPGAGFVDMLRALMVDDSTEDDYQTLLQASEVPRDLPRDVTLGLRLGTSVGGVDLHAAYVWAWDRFPSSAEGALPDFQQIIATDPICEPAEIIAGNVPGCTIFDLVGRHVTESPRKAWYQRRHVVGVDASYTFWELVVRAEVGWSPARTLFDEAMQPVRKPSLLSGLALDWTHSSELSASLESFWFRVLDLSDDESLYLVEPDTYGVAGGVTATYLDDDLKLMLFGMYLASLGDVILAPEVAYKLADGHEVALSAQVYEGDAGSVGGMFDHNDQVVARYTATF